MFKTKVLVAPGKTELQELDPAYEESVQKLKDAAMSAEDLVGADELEQFASDLRRKPGLNASETADPHSATPQK